MKTIVLGDDDTAPAKRALERTAELARTFHANVVVVSVAQRRCSAEGALRRPDRALIGVGDGDGDT